ncbi:hypothetical protein [Burkholderia ubonensis]|uniref:hypothetical protein n=1 Tax=Burkholderia ubonensis TaxID=101571 RepID=UPI0018DFF023
MNLSSSRIVIVIRSVAAIEASSAGVPAAGQLTGHQSGHFYLPKSGHYLYGRYGQVMQQPSLWKALQILARRSTRM